MKRLERQTASHLLQQVHEGLRQPLSAAELAAVRNVVRDLPAQAVFNSASLDRLPVSWPMKAALIAELIAQRCGAARPDVALAATFESLVQARSFGQYEPPEAVQDLLARFCSDEINTPESEASAIADGTKLSLKSVDRESGAVVLSVDRGKRRAAQELSLDRGSLAAWDLPSLRRLHELLSPLLAETAVNPLLAMHRAELEEEEGGVLPELVRFVADTIAAKESGRKASLEEIDALLRQSLGEHRVGEVSQESIQALVESPDPPISSVPAKKRARVRAVDLGARECLVLAMLKRDCSDDAIAKALDVPLNVVETAIDKLCTKLGAAGVADLIERSAMIPELDVLAPVAADDVDVFVRAMAVLTAGRAWYLFAHEQVGVFRAVEKLQGLVEGGTLELSEDLRAKLDAVDKREVLKSTSRAREELYKSLFRGSVFTEKMRDLSSHVVEPPRGGAAVTRRAIVEVEKVAGVAVYAQAAPMVEEATRVLERALELLSSPELLRALNARGPMTLVETLTEAKTGAIGARKGAIAAREMLKAIAGSGATRNERGELAKLMETLTPDAAIFLSARN